MNCATTALPDELDLVAEATAEPSAFAAIYDHYFGRVYNYVRYRVHDPAAADDLTAAAFEKAMTRLGTYRPERGAFSAWLFAIARNAVNDHLRRQQRRRLLSLDALRERATPEPRPEEAVIGDETRRRLLAAVGRLKPRERDILALKFAAGLTNRHIAELTGQGEGNVGVILYRAIRKLRREMYAGEDDDE